MGLKKPSVLFFARLLLGEMEIVRVNGFVLPNGTWEKTISDGRFDALISKRGPEKRRENF